MCETTNLEYQKDAEIIFECVCFLRCGGEYQLCVLKCINNQVAQSQFS